MPKTISVKKIIPLKAITKKSAPVQPVVVKKPSKPTSLVKGKKVVIPVKTAKKVKADLEKVDMGLLKGDAHMRWMDHLSVLNEEIEIIQKSSSIEKQRISFALFNDAFYKSMKIFGLDSGTVYYQYCPMANGDEGAFWFSKISEIKNPYFGDEMLKCGETKETLEFK